MPLGQRSNQIYQNNVSLNWGSDATMAKSTRSLPQVWLVGRVQPPPITEEWLPELPDLYITIIHTDCWAPLSQFHIQ